MWRCLQQGHNVSQTTSSLGPGRSPTVISLPVHPSIHLPICLSFCLCNFTWVTQIYFLFSFAQSGSKFTKWSKNLCQNPLFRVYFLSPLFCLANTLPIEGLCVKGLQSSWKSWVKVITYLCKILVLSIIFAPSLWL